VYSQQDQELGPGFFLLVSGHCVLGRHDLGDLSPFRGNVSSGISVQVGFGAIDTPETSPLPKVEIDPDGSCRVRCNRPPIVFGLESKRCWAGKKR
jgi:hypothetical protein